jgi:GT2 family glycosyltransferase
MSATRGQLVISVVSHRHGPMLASTLDDLVAHAPPDVPIVVTLNIPEGKQFGRDRWPARVVWRENVHPKGFGANHNAALMTSDAEWYAIVNPDIHISDNVFRMLMVVGERDPSIALVAPTIVDSRNALQDSARALPTPARILCRATLRWLARTPRLEGAREWYAGMFMLVRAEAFRDVGGFDERYFLYYEDADLCARLRLAGYRLVQDSGVRAVHDAQRTSHRSFRYLKWHVESLLRLWLSATFWRYRRLLASERATAVARAAEGVSREKRET